MSIERELIKDMKILLECTSMGGLQRNADVLIGRAIELLAQPEQEQEPVAWKETIIELFQSVFDSEMLCTAEGEALIRLEDAICYVEELVIPTHDQPNEPVAWRGVNFTEAEGDWLYRDIEDPFTDSNYRSVGEALYLAPPTREPLDVNKVLMSGTGNGFEYIDGFTDGVLRAEKYHGIGL